MEIRESITFEKGAVLRQPVVIRASHIIVDGNGAMLIGPGQAGKKETYTGVGIAAAGCDNVILRNFVIRGFERAIAISDGLGWVIEGCDCSDNYTDPDFAWGEYERVGAVILTRINNSVIRGNTAQRVWNALDLCECSDNLITANRFCRCTNICLKLDRASRNTILENDFSYGLRIRPDEIHARDSAGVLIENGSDNNFFYRNDITYGGDGVFIRALNAWVSTGNIFVENDCSYAHNNGFEAWCPGNVYIRNKANHCSFGFWLGGSDRTTLIGNEAAFSQPRGAQAGDKRPEFGRVGIIAYGGASTHTLCAGNACHDNDGPGLAFAGDEHANPRWRSQHWIAQDNRLVNNERGVWMKHADLITLAGNYQCGNQQPDVLVDVQELDRHELAASGPRPIAVLHGPEHVRAGETVVFDAAASFDPEGRPLQYIWDVAGTQAAGPRVEHRFDAPGLQRVSLTVTNGARGDLAFREVWVSPAVDELGTENDWQLWQWAAVAGDGRVVPVHACADRIALVGARSLRLDLGAPTPEIELGLRGRVTSLDGTSGPISAEEATGRAVTLTGRLPLTGGVAARLASATALGFWLRVQNPNVNEYKGGNPVIELTGPAGTVRYEPISQKGQPYNWLVHTPFSEARWGWRELVIPLAGTEQHAAGWGSWKRTGPAGAHAKATELRLVITEPGRMPLTLWLDGLHVVQ
jgi:parallel beta-helix repeat protein